MNRPTESDSAPLSTGGSDLEAVPAVPAAVGRDGRARLTEGDRRLLAVFAAGAFLVRAATAIATRHARLGADPTDYDRLGRLLAAGKGFGPALLSPSGGPTAFRPPLYPLFLAGVYKLTADSMLAARLAQAVLGATSVALIWFIARRLIGPRVANLATGLAVFYPPLVMATQALMSESIFVPIMLGGLLAALAAGDGTSRADRWALLTGVFAGLGLLARPNSLAMVPALLLLVMGRRRATLRPGSALRRCGLLLLGVGVLIAPWEFRNFVVMHHFVPISDIDGYNAAGIYNQDAARSPYPTSYQWRPPNSVSALRPLFSDRSLDEVSLGTKLRDAAIDFVRQNPSAPVQAVAWNTFRMMELSGLDQSARAARETGYGRRAAAIAMVSFWVVAALGALGATRPGVRRAPAAFWLAPALMWVGTVLFLGEARLRAPVEPFILLSAAVAVDIVITSVLDRSRPSRISP